MQWGVAGSPVLVRRRRESYRSGRCRWRRSTAPPSQTIEDYEEPSGELADTRECEASYSAIIQAVVAPIVVAETGVPGTGEAAANNDQDDGEEKEPSRPPFRED